MIKKTVLNSKEGEEELMYRGIPFFTHTIAINDEILCMFLCVLQFCEVLSLSPPLHFPITMGYTCVFFGFIL
jgi:hypothetical protein